MNLNPDLVHAMDPEAVEDLLAYLKAKQDHQDAKRKLDEMRQRLKSKER